MARSQRIEVKWSRQDRQLIRELIAAIKAEPQDEAEETVKRLVEEQDQIDRFRQK